MCHKSGCPNLNLTVYMLISYGSSHGASWIFGKKAPSEPPDRMRRPAASVPVPGLRGLQVRMAAQQHHQEGRDAGKRGDHEERSLIAAGELAKAADGERTDPVPDRDAHGKECRDLPVGP